jgi:hypothetical protein
LGDSQTKKNATKALIELRTAPIKPPPGPAARVVIHYNNVDDRRVAQAGQIELWLPALQLGRERSLRLEGGSAKPSGSVE